MTTAAYEDPFEEGLRDWFPMVEAALFPPCPAARLGGVLLHGPTGVGKSALAEALLKRLDPHTVGRRTVDCTALFGKRVGSAEAALADHFAALDDEALQRPCVCVLEDVEGLCLRGARGVTARRCRALLCRLMDRLASRAAAGQRHSVVFVGSCRDPTRLDPAVCEPGRLELLVAVAPPDAAQRATILGHLARGMLGGDLGPGGTARAAAAADDVALEVAHRTHGFVGADLTRLVREALVRALQRTSKSADGPASGSDAAPLVTLLDFEAALLVVLPAGVAAGDPALVPQDPRRFKGIGELGGLQEPWQALDAAVLAPLRLQASRAVTRCPPADTGRTKATDAASGAASGAASDAASEAASGAASEAASDATSDAAFDAASDAASDAAFDAASDAASDAVAAAADEASVAAALVRLGVPSPRGVLLHGPSGSGKTALALALAKAAALLGCRFMNVACTSLVKAEVRDHLLLNRFLRASLERELRYPRKFAGLLYRLLTLLARLFCGALLLPRRLAAPSGRCPTLLPPPAARPPVSCF
jgi:SpoVK/Ycf46/Vps4 family AAA+-type ATPase